MDPWKNQETIVTIVGWGSVWRWSGAHRGIAFGSDDPVTEKKFAIEKADAEIRRIEQKVSAEHYVRSA